MKVNLIMGCWLTDAEGVVPPVGVAEVGLEVICGASDNDMRGRNQGADHQEYGKDRHDDAEPLQQVEVCDFYCLCRTHPEDHRYPEDKYGS